MKRIHKFENEVYQMPEDFQRSILQQLDSLIRKHEQLILLHIEKIKSIEEIEDWDQDCLSRKELLAHFFRTAESSGRKCMITWATSLPALYH
ncbi:hypothetical protein RCO48_05310 [Peribacillus frigoritolerans]|nr:hypothetical protein [Peribacillus frigoritolerans]